MKCVKKLIDDLIRPSRINDCTHRERPEEPVDLPEVLLAAPLPLLLRLQDEDAHRVDAARNDLVQNFQV